MSECCCESSPPEFGGNLPDRECPIHGEARCPLCHKTAHDYRCGAP